jgi:hypothetical protein
MHPHSDVADAALNYFLVLRPSKKAELPSWLVSQMVGNNVVSAGVGVIPLVGDVLLGIWKANSRNAHLYVVFFPLCAQVSDGNTLISCQPPRRRDR